MFEVREEALTRSEGDQSSFLGWMSCWSGVAYY
jgi:hypothetical protein